MASRALVWASLATVLAALPTCFDDGHCLDLTTYVSDEAERGMLAQACTEFPGFHVFGSSQCANEREELAFYASGDKQGLWFSNSTLNEFMSDWVALASNPPTSVACCCRQVLFA
jgi:hypothetical protein